MSKDACPHGHPFASFTRCVECLPASTITAEVRAALDALDRHATVLREFGRDVYLSASAIREVGSEIETQLAILRAALRGRSMCQAI